MPQAGRQIHTLQRAFEDLSSASLWCFFSFWSFLSVCRKACGKWLKQIVCFMYSHDMPIPFMGHCMALSRIASLQTYSTRQSPLQPWDFDASIATNGEQKKQQHHVSTQKSVWFILKKQPELSSQVEQWNKPCHTFSYILFYRLINKIPGDGLS